MTQVHSTIERGKDLFSQAFYSDQCGEEFASEDEAWAHYLANGYENDFEPAPFFLSRWYRWQNPDSKGFACVLDHFVTLNGKRLIDPSPYMDLTRVGQHTGLTTSVEAYLHAIDNAYLEAPEGVFRSYSALQERQNAFMDNLKVELLHDRANTPSKDARRRLVWVQIGPSSEFAKWFQRTGDRSWDVLCNWYNFDAIDLSLGEIALSQRGTKFTGLANAMKHFPEIFDRYDQVLFLDDDLIFEFDSIDRLFDTATENDLSLFQAALTEESFCIWPELKKASSEKWRSFNTVEIMMPGFDMKFLKGTHALFNRSISGFGLDLALGKVASSQGRKIGVVYDVRAKHLQPINAASGPYYEYMRANGINPKLELWKLIEEYDCDLEIKAVK